MKIASVLASKGGTVVTNCPEQTVREALRLFADRNIGALVVVDARHKAVGMITERGIRKRRRSSAGSSLKTRLEVI